MMINILYSEIGMVFDKANRKIGMMIDKLPEAAPVGQMFNLENVKIGMACNNLHIEIGMACNDPDTSEKRYVFTPAVFYRNLRTRQGCGTGKEKSDYNGNFFHRHLNKI
jgi:hypothetical protein